MKLVTYQALIGNPQSVARIRAAQHDIERAGGRVHIAPPTNVGMVLIILVLPEHITPDQVFPGVPFYPL